MSLEDHDYLTEQKTFVKICICQIKKAKTEKSTQKRNQGILSNVGPRPTQVLSRKAFLILNIHRLVKSNFELFN
jgi:hypothetical protein